MSSADRDQRAVLATAPQPPFRPRSVAHVCARNAARHIVKALASEVKILLPQVGIPIPPIVEGAIQFLTEIL